MRYLALACDYDGTLASDGQVSSGTLAALQRFIASGRKLILVTGRELEDLLSVFPHYTIFEWVVAENGVVAVSPGNWREKTSSESATRKVRGASSGTRRADFRRRCHCLDASSA